MPFMVSHHLPAVPSDDQPILPILGRVVPPPSIATVVARYGAANRRRRKIPGELLLLLFVAMHLLPPMALDLVLEALVLGRQVGTAAPAAPAGKSGISHARYRWGIRPLVALVRQVCQPLATPATRGAWYAGLRVMALDSSLDMVADSPANVAVFGRHRGRRGAAGYPQLLGMYLVECGTRAVIDAGFWPYRANVHRAAGRLVRAITPEMLVLWDAGLHSWALLTAVSARGAQVVCRVPAGQSFEPIASLPDGSLLAWLWGAPPSRRTAQTPRLPVRLLTYTLADPTRPGHRTRHRLLTTLLDPAAHPAQRLITLYHERWQIEVVFAEQGTVQRLTTQPFRAHKPRGVLQEAYGLLLAHYAVRALIHDAACAIDVDPQTISCTGAVRLIALFLPIFAVADVPTHDWLFLVLRAAMARHRVPARPHRVTPRARKRPRSKFPIRTPSMHTVRVPPFDQGLVLLPDGHLRLTKPSRHAS